MEFWNDRLTEKSWKTLIDLNKEYDFIVIGGWATYLHTKLIRSKDIDIIVEFEVLEELRKDYELKKNTNLKKYEIIVDEISVDIYVPYFSKLPLPVEELSGYIEKIEGMNVLIPEALLILKQGAEKDRSHSVKGQKDRTDILNLLINSDFDYQKYNEILKEHSLLEYKRRLLEIVRNAKKEFQYLGIEDPGKIKNLKEEIEEKIRKS